MAKIREADKREADKIAVPAEMEITVAAHGSAARGSTAKEVIPLRENGVCCVELPALRMSMAEAETLASMFKAISHPVRLQIVDLLSRYGGQVCVCDIEGHFELSQPTISHHLKILRQAQVVESENRGIWVFYHIRPAAVHQLQTLLAEFRPQTA